jgi:alpha-tubulin suppressor-like RCC1 family protein
LSGEVVCWGSNQIGQLGDGSTTTRTGVVSTPISDAYELALGEEYSCAARLDGTLACWGNNAFGQLGDGTTMNSALPVVSLR